MDTVHQLGFMFSNWYSGATLFALLLDSHPDITCNGETFAFTPRDIKRYVCSCGEPLISCEYYRDVCSHMLAAGEEDWNEDLFVAVPRFAGPAAVNRLVNGISHPLALRRGMVSAVPSWRRLAREYTRAHHCFYDACRRRENSMVYIDGTKSVRRAELMTGGVRPAPRVIHLVRDGRGFCASFIGHNRLGEEGLTRAAETWNQHIRQVETFLQRNRGLERLILRYEDLCSDLAGAMERVCRFHGLPGGGSYTYRPGTAHHILGNKMRKTWDGTVREDRSWRSKLSEKGIRLITGIMEKDLTACGYL